VVGKYTQTCRGYSHLYSLVIDIRTISSSILPELLLSWSKIYYRRDCNNNLEGMSPPIFVSISINDYAVNVRMA